MTARQARMARAALQLGIKEAATRAQVAPNTLARLERGETVNHSSALAIRLAFEQAGIVFVQGDQPGVCFQK